MPEEVPGADRGAPPFGPSWPEVINGRPGDVYKRQGVEGAHKSELVAEAGARKLTRYAKRRYREHPARKVAKWERKDIKARANVDFQKMASEHPELASNPLDVYKRQAKCHPLSLFQKRS